MEVKVKHLPAFTVHISELQVSIIIHQILFLCPLDKLQSQQEKLRILLPYGFCKFSLSYFNRSQAIFFNQVSQMFEFVDFIFNALKIWNLAGQIFSEVLTSWFLEFNGLIRIRRIRI